MISIYLAGLLLVCYNTITLSHLRKLTEIQSTYHSFGLKFSNASMIVKVDYMPKNRLETVHIDRSIYEKDV